MIKLAALLSVALALGVAVGITAARPRARPAAHILADHDAVKLPTGFLDDARVAELDRGCRRLCDLARELMDAWPHHPRVPELAAERWALLENTFQEHADVIRETNQALARSPARKLALEARRALAWSSAHSDDVALGDCVARIASARSAGISADSAGNMLLELAKERTASFEQQRAVMEQLHADPPAAAATIKDVESWATVMSHIRTPLELDVDDVLTGSRASVAKWRGHPLLIHVRRSSDWKPLPEGELATLEDRHRDQGLIAVEVMLGEPEQPSARQDRRIVLSEGDHWHTWDMRFGIRKTPVFLLVDRGGVLRAVTQSWSAAQTELDRELGAEQVPSTSDTVGKR